MTKDVMAIERRVKIIPPKNDASKITVDCPKKFRWTLESEGLNLMFFKAVNFDFKTQMISFQYWEVIEDGDLMIDKWLESLDKHKLKFTSLNEKGEPFYVRFFENLTLTNDRANFSYDLHEPSFREIVLQYKKMEKEISWKYTKK